MKYILNDEYIKTQNKIDSPLTQALLNYKELPPVMLGQVYSLKRMFSNEIFKTQMAIH